MEDLEGFPFYDTEKKRYGIVTKVDKNSIIYIYSPENNVYMIDKINSINEKKICQDVYGIIPIFARINTIDNSVVEFGGQERKKDFLGSSLQVLQFFYTEEDDPAVLLLTKRIDKATIKMMVNDIEFIYPTISIKKSRKPIIKIGDTVKALFNDPCNMYSKGENYEVLNIHFNNTNNPLSIITLKSIHDKDDNIIAYLKYFKKIKNGI